MGLGKNGVVRVCYGVVGRLDLGFDVFRDCIELIMGLPPGAANRQAYFGPSWCLVLLQVARVVALQIRYIELSVFLLCQQ